MIDLKNYRCTNCNLEFLSTIGDKCPNCKCKTLIEFKVPTYKEQAESGKKWCYDCEHFYQDCFCSYEACYCRIYGSLDVDQKEKHPDKTANTCSDYKQKSGKRWFEKIEEEK